MEIARLHLQQACQGLLYPSEDDRPLTVFETAEVPAECGRSETVWVSAADFFAHLEGPKWAQLRAVLEQELDNLHIGRVESGIQVGIVLFGRSRLTGRYIGVRTVAIET